MEKGVILWLAIFLFFFSVPVHADRIDDLEKRIQQLQGELERLKEEKNRDFQDQQDRISRIQEKLDSGGLFSGTDIGGYMELHYNDTINGNNSGLDETLDFHRFVLFFNHELTDWIQFYSELEIEHAFVEGNGKSGEIELEQAYLDFLTGKHLNYRAGILLTPLGIINQYHEPPTFNGVERPFVDTVIIPTTWSESGVGVFGNLSHGFSYQLNVMGGLKAEKFSAKKGIRGGRQKAFKTNVEDLALVGRLDYKGVPGLALGASYYRGDSAQDLLIDSGVRVDILEADFKYSIANLDLRGELAQVRIGDAARLNTVLGKTSGKDAIASDLFGWYVEGAYHFLPLIQVETSQDVALFLRYEDYDTQKEMPSGFTANPAYDRKAWTVGLTYRPIDNLAIKMDYQDLSNKAGTAGDLINLGIGWQF